LTEEVKEIHADVKARYGSPRMHAELVGRGHECCVNTVARIMREAGITAKTKRKFCQTTDSNHSYPVAENVLDRDFDPEKPNASWVADVTYIPTREGWLYLAVVEDLFSRKVVGWSMDATMTSRLVVDALEMALAGRLQGSSSSGLVTHSDRGSQYCRRRSKSEAQGRPSGGGAKVRRTTVPTRRADGGTTIIRTREHRGVRRHGALGRDPSPGSDRRVEQAAGVP